MITHRNAKKEVKRLVAQTKREVNALGRKMNKDATGNQKLFWKELKNVRNWCRNPIYF